MSASRASVQVAYVFSDLRGPPELVGKLQLEANALGKFQYARRFLESGQAFALDPINLPLQTEVFVFPRVPWLPAAILDAGPDDWGRRSLAHAGRAASGLEPLVYGSGTGVGSLLFSLSRDALKPRPEPPGLDDLADMLRGAAAIEAGERPPDHIAKLLDAGSSMGGARPKAVIQHAGAYWLAKFPARDDLVDQPAHESAALTLAERAGIRVPDHQLVSIAGKRVLLVKRFDVECASGLAPRRLHYVSMASLLTVGRVLRPDAVKTTQSYAALANVLAAHGRFPDADRAELFRRMVFNVLLGHVDDHQRNHGLLLRLGSNGIPEGLELSPCFDIAPSNGNAESVTRLPEHQAIRIGREGSARSIRNLFSAIEEFGIDEETALRIFEEVHVAVSGWQHVFDSEGVTRRDQGLVEHRILSASLGFDDVPRVNRFGMKG